MKCDKKAGELRHKEESDLCSMQVRHYLHPLHSSVARIAGQLTNYKNSNDCTIVSIVIIDYITDC